MRKENRERSRIEVFWPSTISTTLDSIDGEIKNISLDGAFVDCRKLPNLEEIFRLDILIPEQQHLSTIARIVRLDICDHDYDSLSYGLAVRFVEICDDDRRLLDSTISHCLTVNSEPEHFQGNKSKALF